MYETVFSELELRSADTMGADTCACLARNEIVE
jgi:hypothetical protein